MLQKAQNASEKSTEASALEKIQVEVAGSYGLDGKIDEEQLNNNLKRISGLKYNNASLSDENQIELPAIVELANNSYTISDDGIVSPLKPQSIGNLTKDNYGDYLDFGQNIEGVGTSSSADDWRILYNDKNNLYGGSDGARVYAILADYLPNSNPVVTASGLNKVDGKTYNIQYTGSRQNMINILNSTTAWQSLIPEELQNNCKVKGATTAEIIMASYNEKYGTDLSYTSTPYLYIDADSSKGIDTLFIPHPGNSDYYGCAGFWLTTPDSNSTGSLWLMNMYGIVCYEGCGSPMRGLCPVVSIPSNLQVIRSTSNGKTIWTLVQ